MNAKTAHSNAIAIEYKRRCLSLGRLDPILRYANSTENIANIANTQHVCHTGAMSYRSRLSPVSALIEARLIPLAPALKTSQNAQWFKNPLED